MPEKEREEQPNKGTLGEAVPADVENAMREQAGVNQEKIDAIIAGALKVYEETKKTGPVHQAIDKADEFMDSAAKEAGVGVEHVMELFTERIPADELTRANQEVAADQLPEEVPLKPIRLETETAKSYEEIAEDIRRLGELVREAEESAKSRVQSALSELETLIGQAELETLLRDTGSKSLDVLNYKILKSKQVASNVIPRDYLPSINGFLSGPERPVLMTADNFEKYKGQYEEIVGDALAEIEKAKAELAKEIGVETKSAPTPAETAAAEPKEVAEAQPPRLTRRETGSEISEEEKDAIVQTTLDVFRQELANFSVSAAEKAARDKFKEIAGKLDKPTYEELRQKVTQEINALEAEERKKMVEAKPELARPEPIEAALPGAVPSDLSQAESRGIEVPEDDIAALRAQAQKLGMAFGDQASAEDIRKRIAEKLEFESKTPIPEIAPKVEDKIVAGPKLEKDETEPEKNETEIVKDQLKDSQEQISEFLLKNPDVSEANRDQLAQTLFQLKRLAEEKPAADAKDQYRWLKKSWDALENASRTMSKNEPGSTVVDSETVRKFYQSPENPPAARPEALEPLPPSELTAEELETIFTVAKAEKVEDLPEAAKEKLGLGFNNLGFFVEENKNKFFASILEKAASKFDAKGTLGRFVGSLAENSRRDQAKAQEKYDAVKQGGREHLSNLNYLGGNILRYGRLALDMTGYSVAASVAAPLRLVMLGAMGFARGAEAAKEARFKNEAVIEKTRVDDLSRAKNEAWRIYKAAQMKTAGPEQNRGAAGSEVTSAELNRAFMEGLPRDILERLAEWSPSEKTSAAANIAGDLTARWINFSLERVQKKLDQAETEAEKQKILKKYESKLNDFNRLVGDYGQIDALAMGAKISEGLAKGARTAMTWESLAELPFSMHKMWSDLAGVLGQHEGKADTAQAATEMFGALKISDTGKSVAEIVGERNGKLVDLYDAALGIDSKDGLSQDEAKKIVDLAMGDDQKKFEEVTDVYGSLKISGTGKTIEDLLSGAEAKPPAIPAAPDTAEASPPLTAAEQEPPPPTPTEGEIGAPSSPDVTSGPADVGAETTPGAPEIKPGRFENTIDAGGDSIWRSTREIFTKNARELGYTEAKGDIAKWAETQTANAVRELADQTRGGKVTDLVHAGDKVSMEIGTDGRPHLKFENLSGREPGFLSQAESKDLPQTELAPTSDIKAETGAAAPETEIGKPAPTPEIGTEAKKMARAYEALPPEAKDEFVYNYILDEFRNKPEEYRQLQPPDFNEEKLTAFVRVFAGGDWRSINNPGRLVNTLDKFNDNLKLYTHKMVDGSLDDIFKAGGEEAHRLTTTVFPVEASNGNILYAQIQENGKWRITHPDGDPLKTRKYIFRHTDLLDLKTVKRILGYSR
ncbi:MAG: hypothetical protein WAP55_02410 [Minisyncoccia bacterium]